MLNYLSFFQLCNLAFPLFQGTEVIQGIALEPRTWYEACWAPKAFSKMCNLKLLILGNLDLPLGLDCLSEGLVYLEWMGFPLKDLPLGIQLDKLVELIMRHSKIQQLWHGIQVKILYFVQ